MDQQLTFADSEFSNKRRQTRKEKFLGRMDKLIPWARLEDVIVPHYPFEEVSQWLSEAGVLLKEGSLIDATIIEAPSSTKNTEGERDPEMHQTKKGNQWHFGMKAHIGVDARTGITHSFTTTSANEHDLNQADQLLHGEEVFIFADAGYRGAKKRDELKHHQADWYIAEQPGRLKALKQRPRINKVRSDRIPEGQYPCES